MLSDLGLLLGRLVTGILMAGHGSQKLFGWFGGHGMEGTAGFLESLGFQPGRSWAFIAGGSEFGSGILTSIGLLHPVGPIMMLAPMWMALTKAHWDRPIWAQQGGGELAVADMAAAVVIATNGPGRFSADRLLGIRLPWPLVVMSMLVTAGGILIATTTKPGTVDRVEDVTLGEVQSTTSTTDVEGLA